MSVKVEPSHERIHTCNACHLWPATVELTFGIVKHLRTMVALCEACVLDLGDQLMSRQVRR